MYLTRNEFIARNLDHARKAAKERGVLEPYRLIFLKGNINDLVKLEELLEQGREWLIAQSFRDTLDDAVPDWFWCEKDKVWLLIWRFPYASVVVDIDDKGNITDECTSIFFPEPRLIWDPKFQKPIDRQKFRSEILLQRKKIEQENETLKNSYLVARNGKIYIRRPRMAPENQAESPKLGSKACSCGTEVDKDWVMPNMLEEGWEKEWDMVD
ncbi:hypothetical protein M501DRAFT_986159 [Patellaria atrata CBS 101060]|uniref:Uncharacterized protein n=1 Tax=Patellaria atrata CBS 101060 TaxID=1346257 RepID=A0A9P4S8H8_9PEZI|nr:hypothetical protein M501DRAFT_986159 [Patellaria atrata CBS 101060]